MIDENINCFKKELQRGHDASGRKKLDTTLKEVREKNIIMS